MIKNQIFKFRENCPAPDRGPKKSNFGFPMARRYNFSIHKTHPAGQHANLNI
jgi:hypothetical protein